VVGRLESIHSRIHTPLNVFLINAAAAVLDRKQLIRMALGDNRLISRNGVEAGLSALANETV
jgi:hypothetical protein